MSEHVRDGGECARASVCVSDQIAVSLGSPLVCVSVSTRAGELPQLVTVASIQGAVDALNWNIKIL